MNKNRRRQLARSALDGYAHGPGAPIEATKQALQKADGARAVIVVEGISDQIAVETLAERQGRDLNSQGVAVVPVGGAQAVGAFLNRFGPSGAGLILSGMCDLGEEEVFKRALTTAGIGSSTTRAEMEDLGFHVCVTDLEDELLRAAGPAAVEALFDSQGDLGSFRAMQNQPAWRGQAVHAQMRRFLGAGARRKLRYARLLVDSMPLAAVPPPLVGALAGA